MDSFIIARSQSETTTSDSNKLFSPSPIRKNTCKLHSSIAQELDFSEDLSSSQLSISRKSQSAMVSSGNFLYRKTECSSPSDVSAEDDILALRNNNNSRNVLFSSPEFINEIPSRSSNPLASALEDC
mmetsp:Transcript_39483/g.35252  ORF Transcript_39483/g.35252 Transcript_39483/m.35252 type:complete len:127 (-) Transcript_39483:1694-2074(-)